MLTAVLTALPIALGTILATLPVLAVPLLLVTRPDHAPLHGFLAGWLAGFLALGGIAILFADIVMLAGSSGSLGLESVGIVLGLALLAFAAMKWRKRPLPGEDPETPGWMQRFDTVSPSGAALIGAALATLNPKNALLIASGALAIATATPRPAAQAAALVIHSLIASAGLLAPFIAVLLLGDRALVPLDRLRDLVARHNATVMATVLGALGLLMIVSAVT